MPQEINPEDIIPTEDREDDNALLKKILEQLEILNVGTP